MIEGPAQTPAQAVKGLAATVHHVLGVLQSRRGPAPAEVRSALNRLRYFARDAPDPALRAAVHVACAHLSAGNVEEADSALTTAARILSVPARRTP